MRGVSPQSYSTKCTSAAKYTGSQRRKIRNPDLHSAVLSDIIDSCNRTCVAAQDRHIHIEPLQMPQDASHPFLSLSPRPPKSNAFNHTSLPHQSRTPKKQDPESRFLQFHDNMQRRAFPVIRNPDPWLFIPTVKLFASTAPGFRNLGGYK